MVINEFREFLKEYKVLALAVAFVMGTAVNTLISSFVTDILMPIITPFVPEGGWESATLALGPFVLKWGSFLASFLNFMLIAIAVFFLVKAFGNKKTAKK